MLRRKGQPSRSLAAVVFTDIAGSTEVAARLGDEGWKQLLERHLRLVRSALYRFGGREIDTAGDGVYAIFESPARAISFALDVAERAEALDIEVRSGVHMGEVELIGGKAGGIAVHIGARIAALAEPGEVLVSGTVRDLVTGSAVGFKDRGTFELKGVPGRWALYLAGALEQPPALPKESRLPLRERIGMRLRSTRWRVAIALSLMVTVAASAFAILLQPRYLSGVEANSVGRISAVGNGIISSIPVGSLPDAIAFGEGSLWVTDTTSGSVARIDPDSSHVLQRIEVEGSPNAVAIGHGSVWVSNGSARTISRVSPATNKVVTQITVGNGPSGVATDDRWVWATSRLDGTLARIDPQNNLATSFHVGTTPAGVTAGAGSVWVSDFDSASVARVDPATGATVARILVGNGPTSIAGSGDQIWVVNSRDGTVSRIDPSSNRVATTIPVGDEPGAVAAAESVWVTVASTSEIVRIDPSSNTVVRRIPVQNRPRGIAVAGADTWFTVRAAAASHRGGILRIVVSDASGFLMPTTLDPARGGGFGFGLEQMLLTNDGLVSFKRVGGADGLTLVPDLAISIPTPTDGGRTYTFQLRPGIVYSDGRSVHAVDVLRSLERLAVIDRSHVDHLFGKSLEGANACATATATCDLSTLVQVDEQTDSVTFRLSAPDPEFLYKLAFPEYSVLPADTPREPATAPLPATGPYMAQPFDADGGIRLIRNKSFVEWSHEAQPEGYPDEIVWRVAPKGEDLVGSVVAGSDDSIFAFNALSPDRVASLSNMFADQLYALPPDKTFFETMNTKLPPFNQLDVRKAVNMATDRTRAIEVYGGSSSGRETCQAQPPGFPGYEPYCPYTVNPGTAWLAPNIAEARDLIAGAGVAGTPVTVRAWGELEGHVAVGAYFVELLEELGFDASLKTELLFGAGGEVDAYTADWQMMGNFFVGGFPTPYGEIIEHFTCPDFPVAPDSYGNYAAFCDPEIDALALRAYELYATDRSAANHAWAEIDHLIVDQSPAVAVFNPTGQVFVSQRVGNVQLSPQLGVLLDQLWVQ